MLLCTLWNYAVLAHTLGIQFDWLYYWVVMTNHLPTHLAYINFSSQKLCWIPFFHEIFNKKHTDEVLEWRQRIVHSICPPLSKWWRGEFNSNSPLFLNDSITTFSTMEKCCNERVWKAELYITSKKVENEQDERNKNW